MRSSLFRRGLLCSMALLILLMPTRAQSAQAAEDGAYQQYLLAKSWNTFVQSDTRPKIGIAFGGGGARGMAHIGVIRALERANIPIDVVTGTSIGSFIGSLYATGASIDRIEELALITNWGNLIEHKTSTIGVFSTSRLQSFIGFHLNNLSENIMKIPTAGRGYENSSREIQFSELKRPFLCVATDLYTGEIVIFDSGPVAQAVRASCSIPGLFEPVTDARGRLLVDGGIMMNLPVSLARKAGADIVIAVDLESDTSVVINNLVDMLAQMIRLQGRALTDKERRSADFVISPRVGTIATTDLNSVAKAIREGEIAGYQQIDAIRRGILGFPEESGRPSPSELTEWRETVNRVTPPALTATVQPDARELVRAAAAASRLGLFREALSLLVPLGSRGNDPLILEHRMMSAIRTGNLNTAREALPRYLSAEPKAESVWMLAAAAVDAGDMGLAEEFADFARGETFGGPRGGH